MNAEEQGGAAETENLATAKALWGDEWFWPILEELENFEQLTMHLFPEANDAIADDAPDWVFKSVWKCGLEWKSYNGLGDPKKMDARRVGMMLGMKWSLCDAYARAFPTWNTLNPDQILKKDAEWFPGFCHQCKEFTGEFAEKWSPHCRQIESRAGTLACQEGLKDYVDYLQGHTQGVQFFAKVMEKLKASNRKPDKDAKARNAVFFFAMCCGRMIEDAKGELSWPEIYQLFLEFTEYKVEIDEEAFKQILVRAGLKGVGKVGRPVPIDPCTPLLELE